MKSFVINKTEWITSVWWQDIKAKGRKEVYKNARLHYKKNAKKAYDAFCILESPEGYQAGYVEWDRSLPMSNQKALAALFAAKYENCAIRLVFESGVWVCGIGDGLVEPDSDLFGTEEETERAFNEFYPLRDWDEIIESYDPKQSIELIQSLSDEVSNVSELRPVIREANKKRIYQVAGILALLLLIMFFGKAYLDRKAKDEKAEAAAKRAAIIAKLDEESYLKKVDQLQFKKVWEFEPPAQMILNSCYAEMKTFPLVEKGWLLDILTCTQTGIKAQWERLSYARFTDLPVNAVFDVNDPAGKQAISEWQRKISIPPRKTLVQLLKKPEGAADLYQIAKDYQFAVSATWPKPEVRIIPARNPNEKPQSIVSPYSKCVWELSGEYCPEDEMINILSDLPGMMIKEVIHIYKKEQWIIKGEFYVL